MTDEERAGTKRATAAQVRYLTYLGVGLEKAHCLTKYEASQLIAKLKREREGIPNEATQTKTQTLSRTGAEQ